MSKNPTKQFGKAWVEAEKEAALAFELLLPVMKMYNKSENPIDQDRVMGEVHMAMLNSIVLELRALRMFMVATYSEHREWEE